jgi:molybdenum cofactor cytidylyltransferase
MNRQKLLLPYGQGTVLSASVLAMLQPEVARVLVVLGCDADMVRSGARLPADPRVEVMVNEAWAEGLSASLRCGIESCGEADAVAVALGDEPGLAADTVRRVVSAWRPGRRLVVPRAGGRCGHPVVLGRDLWPEVLALRGDVGARELIRSHEGETLFVEAALAADVDTEADYRALVDGMECAGTAQDT